MKKYKIFFIIIALGILASCAEDNGPADLFKASPEERTNQLVADYKNILKQPTYGWVGYYSSNNDRGGYLLLMKFDEGTVKIKSEALDFINQPLKEEEVTYRVGVKQQPELVFESYSIFQIWHDALIPGQDKPEHGEFQFTFDKVTESEIILKSKTDINNITYLTLKPARQIDWNLDGLPEMERKLFSVSPSKYVISQKLVGSNYSQFAELDIVNRILYLEEADGKVSSIRFGITRRGIVLVNPITINGEKISEFIYSEAEHTIISDSPGKYKIVNVTNDEIRYIKPAFSAELFILAPKSFVTKTWVYTKSPALKEVRKLEVILKEYSDYFGLEYLTNLREFRLSGCFMVNPVIDFSKNKELRSIAILINPSLAQVVIENLPNLEVVVCTANPLIKSIDLTKSLPNLREVHAHLNNRTDFTLMVRGASKLETLQASQNGWKSLDVTGCSALKSLTINSGNNFVDESDDDSKPTISDIEGLSAEAMPKLTKLMVPSTAKCGTNVHKFYLDTKKEGRSILMMHGHALIKPEKNPEYVYKDDTCN